MKNLLSKSFERILLEIFHIKKTDVLPYFNWKFILRVQKLFIGSFFNNLSHVYLHVGLKKPAKVHQAGV